MRALDALVLWGYLWRGLLFFQDATPDVRPRGQRLGERGSYKAASLRAEVELRGGHG
jgi:hypothetical protein